MATKSEEALARAEAQFKKRTEAAREGEIARAEYDAKARAMDEKTARLKKLRLAKEAKEAKERESDKRPSATAKKASSLVKKKRAR